MHTQTHTFTQSRTGWTLSSSSSLSSAHLDILDRSLPFCLHDVNIEKHIYEFLHNHWPIALHYLSFIPFICTHVDKRNTKKNHCTQVTISP